MPEQWATSGVDLHLGRMPTARNYAHSVVDRDRIYLVGGSTTAGDAHHAIGRIVRWFAPR